MWIGLRPWVAEQAQPIAQFLAAFPANVLFPMAVVGIVSFRLDPNIWLSPLMVLGTQWYILFNVIARSERVSDRPARGVDGLPPALLAVVAEGDPAGDFSLLPDWCAYGLGRFLEREHCCRSRKLG